MLSVNYLIKNKVPINHVLTDADKKELLTENKDADYSYLCLMREMFVYKHITVRDLFNGWGGVNLVKI